jgi:hypothetical protein
MGPKTELIFPAYLISSLRDLRGEAWQDLVDRVASLPETHPESLAFALMMVELDGCMRCNSTSYKFLRGCAACATQAIQSFKGTDEELLAMYEQAQRDLNEGVLHTIDWDAPRIKEIQLVDIERDSLSLAA